MQGNWGGALAHLPHISAYAAVLHVLRPPPWQCMRWGLVARGPMHACGHEGVRLCVWEWGCESDEGAGLHDEHCKKEVRCGMHVMVVGSI